jgi:glucose dehydrogenase
MVSKGAGAPTAAPVVYTVNGREYVAMAFGGQPDSDTPLGDTMVAFALPHD